MSSPRRGERAAPPRINALILRLAFLLVLPIVIVATPREAHAYQWMLMHGYPSCGVCHTDPSGGELLTAYGRMQSEAVLSMIWGSSDSSALNFIESRPRLVRKEPQRLAARAKLAGKDEATEGEKVDLDETTEGDAASAPAGDAPADAEAKAEATTETEAEAAPTEQATTESKPAEGYEDGLGPITPFLFRLWAPPDWLVLGGSYRHLNIITPQSEKKFRTFPMMMDLYGQLQFGSFRAGGSIGVARVAAGSPYARPAQVTANQGKEFNLLSRTHFVGYNVTDSLDVRVGRLNLPFGVRVPEHTIWARQVTRTDRESGQQHGIDFHYAGNSFRAEVMGIAGNYQINPDRFRERGYAGYFEYFVGEKTVVGVSSMLTVAKEDRQVLDGAAMTRQAHGGLFRAAVSDSVVFVAEANALMRSRYEMGYVGFTQLDWQAVQGLHFMLTGELLDEGHATAKDAPMRAPGSGKPRVGAWASASWWFLPHFDVRLDVLKRTQEDLSILAQLHAYL